MKIILLIAFLLTACTHVTLVNGPDGAKFYQVTCNGTALYMSNCFNRAAEICDPLAYKIQGSEQHTQSVNNIFNGQYVGEKPMRTLLFTCEN